MPPLQMIARADGLRLACRYREGAGPAIVFLPGYMSDMDGGKALALDAWAAQEGRAMLRLDYAGCGASEGAFTDGTLASWRDDARFLIDCFVPGEVILVGSSMGGWIALLLARALGAKVRGLVGIAAAPDFTQWGFTDDQKAVLQSEGQIVEPTDYGDQPYVTTRAFWESGQANRLLDAAIPIEAPVRLVQGQADPDVPWLTALTIARRISSADVQTLLVKDGDHRLSRPEDIALLLRTVATLP
ncbi:alpha/beta hydrolase [Sphingobium sufflavum]|uniref:alpha/beta fold hydrolase n=1 Tax=Sphingobium sufflavum TaxID=1129547 RepID=UPI001F2B619A|nr:alpha/beta hydrolase [Sphingobium sufflavum]MCE7794979.1 alpha/beta hydrolase [Sphingobium sufflavum]